MLAEDVKLERLSKTFDIEFDNLGLVLPNGVEIMGRVTGSLKSGRACAIMGPSGAGKTTFVTLLTGKVQRTSGSVKLNGQHDELSKYSQLIGYVPQEDIMLRELTVFDVLLHSARMRLPRSMTSEAVIDKVSSIVSFLGLSHVAQTVIGDEETRGISGGQRKRVNIGMELVAEPSVLFLDEPTSGLDSSTSYEVCANLRQIAEQQGLTVAAVIHSPSPATFKQFHDFMLLGKGGHVVYIGPREGCVEYFKKIGFTCPADESPSDFFMDVVTGKVASEFNPAFVPRDLFDYWEQHMQGRNPFEGVRRMSPQEAEQERKAHLRSKVEENKIPELAAQNQVKKSKDYYGWTKYIVNGTAAFGKEWYSFFLDVGTEFIQWLYSITIGLFMDKPIRQVQPFYMQFYYLMKRAALQVYKTAGKLMSEMILHFCAGLFISIAVQNFDFLGKNPQEVCSFTSINIVWFCQATVDQLGMAGMFICLGAMFAGISVGANTFGRERVVYWRDAASGMSVIPYFLAKFVVDIPRIVLGSTFYALALALFFPYRQAFVTLYILVVTIYFVSFAMGYWISTAFPLSRAALIGTGFALLWALVLSGVVPKLSEVKDPANPYPGIISWLWDVSAPRWAIEGFWLKEVDARAWDEKNEDPTNAYVKNNYNDDVSNIVAIGFVWCLFSLLGLKLFNRSKQK
ncbi:P-loop containing nucleoside triphosphate hydrolase protein [Gorgonomyces haynaldii]|nr:P-loop containing nucleoside triphosphate hydrolase protein [Gorgonomyces haynaldii]